MYGLTAASKMTILNGPHFMTDVCAICVMYHIHLSAAQLISDLRNYIVATALARL